MSGRPPAATLHVIPLLEEALSSLPTGDSGLRAMLMARLSSAIRDQPFRDRRLSLSEEAVEMAKASGRRRSATPMRSTRGASRSSAPRRPSSSATRPQRSCASASSHEIPTGILQGHLYRIFTSLQLGDMPAARRELATVTRLAEESREPGFRTSQQPWLQRWPSSKAVSSHAPELIRRGHESGRRADPFTALAMYVLQMFVLHREQGAPPYEENELREFAAQQPSYTILRCALAAFLTGDGRTAEATHAVRRARR